MSKFFAALGLASLALTVAPVPQAHAGGPSWKKVRKALDRGGRQIDHTRIVLMEGIGDSVIPSQPFRADAEQRQARREAEARQRLAEQQQAFEQEQARQQQEDEQLRAREQQEFQQDQARQKQAFEKEQARLQREHQQKIELLRLRLEELKKKQGAEDAAKIAAVEKLLNELDPDKK